MDAIIHYVKQGPPVVVVTMYCAPDFDLALYTLWVSLEQSRKKYTTSLSLTSWCLLFSLLWIMLCCSSRVHFVNTYILFFIVQSKKRICTLRDSLHGECPSITILKLDYCSTYLSMLAKFKTVDPVSYVNVSPREREILITTPKCNSTRRGKIIWHWTPISLLLLSKFNPDNTSTDRLGFGFFESGANWRSIGQVEFSSFFCHIDDFSRYKEPKKKKKILVRPNFF